MIRDKRSSLQPHEAMTSSCGYFREGKKINLKATA
jgi:hypothetical protein